MTGPTITDVPRAWTATPGEVEAYCPPESSAPFSRMYTGMDVQFSCGAFNPTKSVKIWRLDFFDPVLGGVICPDNSISMMKELEIPELVAPAVIACRMIPCLKIWNR
jgi:hypothetical protein